jgi:hypothetical protein
MSEQKEQPTEKKKAGIVKRTLKWLGLGLITFLLIVSIVFQSPWKAITLFAVIFLACTILPKPCRKYFWLCVGGVVAAIIIWVFLPEGNESWRPYTFDKELAALEAKYTIPDGENAAIIYNQLLEDYNEAVFEPDFIYSNLRDLIRKEPWSSKYYPEVAQWLGQQEGIIAKLIEASKIEQCRFPINADAASVYDILHRLKPMKMWSLLLIWAANNDMAEGRINQALEKYIAVIQMGKQLRQQPSMLDFLAGTGIERSSTSQLKRFIVRGNITEENLSVIERAFEEIKHDWNYDLPRILDYEKLLVKNFWGMFYEVNTDGKIRLTRSLANTTREQLLQDMQEEPGKTYLRKKLMKARGILYWLYMPPTPQKAGEVVDAAYERCYAMAEPDFNWAKDPREFSITSIRLNCLYMIDTQLYILEPVYYNIHNTYLRTIAQQRGSRLIIALRRYKNKNGNWPGSLDEVKSLAAEEIFIDPTNGGPFIYKLTDENFTLYSNGKYKDEFDDWPIWPID